MNAVRIRAENAGPMTGTGTNTWLVLGAEPTLIDAAVNSDAYAARVADELEAHQPGATLVRVLVTHAHGDHIGGVEAIQRRWPQAIFAKLPDPERDARHPVTFRPLKDDGVVRAGDSILEVIHTPGHAPDHLCFFEPNSATMFGGDLLVNGGTVAIPVSAGGSLTQYLRSLRRVLDLKPRRILPGHGEDIEQPGSLIRGYLGHRMLREQQILDTLERAPQTAEEVVERLYQGLQPELMPAAAENVLAHLLKLQDEQRVSRGEDARWSLTAPSTSSTATAKPIVLWR